MTEGTSKVAPIFGGPTGEKQANLHAIATLEEILEAARAGEIVGVMVASLCYDRLGRWDVAGETGGYSIIGAAEAGKLDLMRRIGDLNDEE